ncbi:hypothetical protein [Streptomyces djakartensis]|uniref:Uncharacterized protein n=1 Tax=Streptomyces djakartensis TaxID=68193 RepID=A0ABQ2ZI20_9ACTN|nr:hypothetical protein [Streptomyces djakartensis]GGY16036.1 hypothetical protein GCM10010384_22510 [Streptomyces djakartensis]
MGTTLAAIIAGVAGQRQVRAEHRHWRRQLRRDAYAAFTVKADEAYEALRGVEVELARPGHDLDGLRSALDETRRLLRGDLVDVQTAVELEGPEALARMAGELTKSLSACAAAIHARLLGRDSNDALEANESHRIRRFLNHASNKREQFVSHARRAIDV